MKAYEGDFIVLPAHSLNKHLHPTFQWESDYLRSLLVLETGPAVNLGRRISVLYLASTSRKVAKCSLFQWLQYQHISSNPQARG